MARHDCMCTWFGEGRPAAENIDAMQARSTSLPRVQSCGAGRLLGLMRAGVSERESRCREAFSAGPRDASGGEITCQPVASRVLYG
jgi:hypothetical protein